MLFSSVACRIFSGLDEQNNPLVSKRICRNPLLHLAASLWTPPRSLLSTQTNSCSEWSSGFYGEIEGCSHWDAAICHDTFSFVTDCGWLDSDCGRIELIFAPDFFTRRTTDCRLWTPVRTVDGLTEYTWNPVKQNLSLLKTKICTITSKKLVIDDIIFGFRNRKCCKESTESSSFLCYFGQTSQRPEIYK